MDGADRRLISELVTRYEFHKEFRDLFVEGETDQRFFRWFFASLPIGEINVYEIDSVEMTPQDVAKMGVSEEGHKGRLIAFALTLEKALPLSSSGVLCVTDRDFHDFGYPLPECRYLVYTDFACLECYVLSTNPIAKLCTLYFRKEMSSDEIDSMMTILRDVFYLRLAKRKLSPSAAWYEKFTTCCSISDGRVQLDRNAYLAKVLNAMRGASTQQAMENEVTRIGGAHLVDRRHAIHGHDAVQLISWIAREKGVPNRIADVVPLERAMWGHVEIAELSKLPLFERLKAWSNRSP